MKKYIIGFLFAFVALFAYAGSASAMDSAYRYEYHRELQHGSSGNDVVMLEFCLARIYQKYYDIDGYFDSRTKRLVKDFQAKHHLRRDGILGPRTAAWLALECNKDLVNTVASDSGYIPGGKKTIATKATKHKSFSKKTLQPKKVNKNHHHVQTKYSLNKDKTEATVAFSFKVKNTTSKKIHFNNIHDFFFSLNGEAYRADELESLRGFDLDLFDTKKKHISGEISLKPGQEQGFILVVRIKPSRMKDVQEEYVLSLEKCYWNLGKRQKTLELGKTVRFSLTPKKNL